MKKSLKIIVVILGLVILVLSLFFIRKQWKGDSVVIVFKNEFCTDLPFTFQIIYENGNFNNDGEPVACNESVSREIHPAGKTSFSVTVFLPTEQIMFRGGVASPYDGSINTFILTDKKEILHSQSR